MKNNQIVNALNIEDIISKCHLRKGEAQLVKNIFDTMAKNGSNWVKSWRCADGCHSLPVNARGKQYHGTNLFSLLFWQLALHFTSNKWFTFIELKEANKKLIKGATGCFVDFFFKNWDYNTHSLFDANSEEFVSLTKEEQKDYLHKYVKDIKKTYAVFNECQTEGYILNNTPRPLDDLKDNLENFLDCWNNELLGGIHYGGDEAFYNPKNDLIQLPLKTDFSFTDDFYQTALHEIAHSTGCPLRLNRKKFNDYPVEELVAELSSLLLSDYFNLDLNANSKFLVKNSSAYLNGWLSRCHDAPRDILYAVNMADKVVSYIEDYFTKNSK